MGIREGRFCDFTVLRFRQDPTTQRDTDINEPCSNLAIGACVLCERDVCHEQHSFLKDKFVPGASGHGCALAVRLVLRHVAQQGAAPGVVQDYQQPAEHTLLVCGECGGKIGYKLGKAIGDAETAIIGVLRALLTTAALKKDD